MVFSKIISYLVALLERSNFDIIYLTWLWTLFKPLCIALLTLFLLPAIILLFMYGSSLFCLIYKHWNRLKVNRSRLNIQEKKSDIFSLGCIFGRSLVWSYKNIGCVLGVTSDYMAWWVTVSMGFLQQEIVFWFCRLWSRRLREYSKWRPSSHCFLSCYSSTWFLLRVCKDLAVS